MHRIVVMAGDSLGEKALEDCWEWGVSLASKLGETVLIATIDEAVLPVPEFVFSPRIVSHGELVHPVQEPAPVMSSAPFVYRDDGQPDWGAMWGSFCELALFGGPPHRGEASAIRACKPVAAGQSDWSFDPIAEIARGIFETTGLEAVAAEPSWLGVSCDSAKMAAWLCAAIILENVDARSEGNRLMVPARPDYRLKEEVKSVITVVAKTHHYWLEHSQQCEAPTCRPLSPAARAQAMLRHNHPPVTAV
jgi:sirohydrochlorin cobaltochelatase